MSGIEAITKNSILQRLRPHLFGAVNSMAIGSFGQEFHR